MKITIITPTYNSMATLKQTMDSMAAQSFAPHEYIIMDGGSSDGTVEFALSHGAATHVISEKDSGIADAFNKGIALATGDFVGIINSDDWYAADTFALLAKTLKNNSNVDIIHGKVQYWNENTPTEIYIPNQEKLIQEMTINHPSVFVRKEIYERIGVFDTNYKYAMDYELILRFWMNKCTFVAVDEVLANMRYGGASDKYWYKAYAEVARAKRKYFGCVVYNYFMWQVLRTSTRKLLEKFGLQNLIKQYRKHKALMKKN